jgi:hypothetical protein
LDLPGIIEGAAEGKGRGRQVIAVGKTSVFSRLHHEFYKFLGFNFDNAGRNERRCAKGSIGG